MSLSPSRAAQRRSLGFAQGWKAQVMADKSRLTKSLLGAGAIGQGLVLIAISFVTVTEAIQAADILYAEDFDRMDHVPLWFGPWHFATRHWFVSGAAFFLSGLAWF